MKLHCLFVACVLVAGCGSNEHGSALPPPATFDASTDTGKKDSGTLADTSLLADASDAAGCISGKTCIGDEMPTWQLEDFQPKSSRYRTTYGLEAFRGKVTVVALLSGW
jgi:hypothetical protein